VLACVDVDYREKHAIAACLVFKNWTDETPVNEHGVRIEPIAEYVSGEFYRRELPCILAVLKAVKDPLELIVIDGYVWLEDQTRKGLGAHLYDALNKQIPVIGVAKTRFQSALAAEVLRGKSATPLFVTALGIDRDAAAAHVRSMHGAFRIPTLLKRVDFLCRNWKLEGT
jgi:deoxyribonuclease V